MAAAIGRETDVRSRPLQGAIVERFIDAPDVMARRRPSMNCVVERALAASHAVAGDYGFLTAMRKR